MKKGNKQEWDNHKSVKLIEKAVKKMDKQKVINKVRKEIKLGLDYGFNDTVPGVNWVNKVLKEIKKKEIPSKKKVDEVANSQTTVFTFTFKKKQSNWPVIIVALMVVASIYLAFN